MPARDHLVVLVVLVHHGFHHVNIGASTDGPHAQPDSHPNRHGHGNGYGYPNCDCHRLRNTLRHADEHPDGDADEHTYGDADEHPDGHGDEHPDGHGDQHPDGHGHQHAHPRADRIGTGRSAGGPRCRRPLRPGHHASPRFLLNHHAPAGHSGHG